MRLFSWYGAAALATAASCGYLAGVGQRNPLETPRAIAPMPSLEEEATPPPGLVFRGTTIEGVRIDDIDLTCPPHFALPFDLFLQTNEPPMATAPLHLATFEFPAGLEGGAAPPIMPYLD